MTMHCCVAPFYHASTTTNPLEEPATDSGIEHVSFCVLLKLVAV